MPGASRSACGCGTRVFDKLVYAKLREAMGGKVQYAVSGGAPLGTRLGHFFRGIGVTILEGYGLTETTAPATVNRPDAMRIGYGRPAAARRRRAHRRRRRDLPARRQRLPRATAGTPRPRPRRSATAGSTPATSASSTTTGFLRITGRKKEILVTAGGKNVAPAVLEDRLRAHPLVSQCIVVGDGKPFIAALVTLDEEMYPGVGSQQRARRRPVRRRPHRRAGARRDPAGRRRREHRGLQGGVDPQVRRSSRVTSPRSPATSPPP